MHLHHTYVGLAKKISANFPDLLKDYKSNLIPKKCLKDIKTLFSKKEYIEYFFIGMFWIISNHIKEDKLDLTQLKAIYWNKVNSMAHGIYNIYSKDIHIYCMDEENYYTNLLVLDHELYHYWAHINNLDYLKIHKVDPNDYRSRVNWEWALKNNIVIRERVEGRLYARFNWRRILEITDNEITK